MAFTRNDIAHYALNFGPGALLFGSSAFLLAAAPAIPAFTIAALGLAAMGGYQIVMGKVNPVTPTIDGIKQRLKQKFETMKKTNGLIAFGILLQGSAHTLGGAVLFLSTSPVLTAVGAGMIIGGLVTAVSAPILSLAAFISTVKDDIAAYRKTKPVTSLSAETSKLDGMTSAPEFKKAADVAVAPVNQNIPAAPALIA